MTKEQIDQFNMLLSVENHFDDNIPAWTTNVPINTTKVLLSNQIKAIADQMALQLINSTGITIDKDNARKALQDQAFIISAAVSGYADITNKYDLYKRVNYTKTDLERYRDAEIVGICFNLHKDTNAEITNLAPYGILPATLITFNTAITNFSAIMKNPNEAIDKRKVATEKIMELLPLAMNTLYNRLDNLMVALSIAQPTFVDVYHNAREINSSPTNAWSLTTTCLDSETQLPILGVTLSVLGTGLHRTSPSTGFNTYQNLVEGGHKIEATHPNYISQTVLFTIVNSQTTELAILLVHK